MLYAKSLTQAVIATLFVALLTACSSIPDNTIRVDTGTLSIQNEPAIAQHLYQHYQDWRGTPYAWGGMSRRGVDCSGFVYLTLRDQFGAYLPRTTAKQVQTGYHVDKDELEAGDLVFFKTSSKVRHVGIYVKNGTFLHASTSQGVIISSLDNVYWKKHYWHGRRIR
ncbi:NlpC/P60 family protein [Marinomonas gallaica]|uniref:NlpC/P60 family protein n=1 Tax=Marinomonas gallaica TaxID=1806667 RepID=UPI003CE5AD73